MAGVCFNSKWQEGSENGFPRQKSQPMPGNGFNYLCEVIEAPKALVFRT